MIVQTPTTSSWVTSSTEAFTASGVPVAMATGCGGVEASPVVGGVITLGTKVETFLLLLALKAGVKADC